MRKAIIYLSAIFLLSSCARGCQGCSKQITDNQKQNIRVTLYSGGQEVKVWEFYGIVNDEDGSAGYYFYYNNKLVEVSGDIVIEHLD